MMRSDSSGETQSGESAGASSSTRKKAIILPERVPLKVNIVVLIRRNKFVVIVSALALHHLAVYGNEFVPSIDGQRLFMSPQERLVEKRADLISVEETLAPVEGLPLEKIEIPESPGESDRVPREVAVSLDGVVLTPGRKPSVWVNEKRQSVDNTDYEVVSVESSGATVLRIHGVIRKIRPGTTLVLSSDKGADSK